MPRFWENPAPWNRAVIEFVDQHRAACPAGERSDDFVAGAAVRHHQAGDRDVAFPGLPGRPRHNRELGEAIWSTSSGATSTRCRTPASTGCSSATRPTSHTSSSVGPEIPAAMAAVIGELRSSVRVPFGVNILWDAKASLALARATGATLHPRGAHRRVRERPRDDRSVDRRPRRLSHRDRRRRRRALRQHLAGVQQRARHARHRRSSPRRGVPRRRRDPHLRPGRGRAVRDERPADRQGRGATSRSSPTPA